MLDGFGLDNATIGTSESEQQILEINHDDFVRWRPKYHVMPHKNWMNDPCAPGYNPKTKTYHLGFQCNPKGSQWGNMSWGSALSTDMLRWDVNQFPSMKPEADIDRCGVFTGCMRPTNPQGVEDGQLTCFYTSATSLPIHWALPYQRGSERVHMATSDDNGKTWNRVAENPIVAAPPDDVDVTGWRDPFIERWQSVDDALGSASSDHLYALVSGGIRDNSPTAFLYRLKARDLREWEYISPLLLLPGLNVSPSRWTGDFGTNWECANFLSFSDAHHHRTQDFLIVGVEGRRITPENRVKSEIRATHAQMWICGDVQARDQNVQMKYSYGGRLDHGCFYAANSFWDPVIEEYVVFGWILEDDLPRDLQVRQGWSGCQSIPRLVKLLTWTGVTGTLRSPLSTISSVSATPDSHGAFTVQTLSAIPDPRLARLRGQKSSLSPGALQMRSVGFPEGCAQWELDASFTIVPTTQKVGLVISHSKSTDPASEQRETVVFFEPCTETFMVERSKSTKIPQINLSVESAPHTLFSFAKDRIEPLQIRIFCDTSVLEIFVNERTVISTRIYAESRTCYRIEPFVETAPVEGMLDRSCSELINLDVWQLSQDHVDETA